MQTSFRSKGKDLGKGPKAQVRGANQKRWKGNSAKGHGSSNWFASPGNQRKGDRPPGFLWPREGQALGQATATRMGGHFLGGHFCKKHHAFNRCHNRPVLLPSGNGRWITSDFPSPAANGGWMTGGTQSSFTPPLMQSGSDRTGTGHRSNPWRADPPHLARHFTCAT